MSSNAHLNIARTFQRTDPSLLGGHPMRGNLKETIQREHLLRRDDNDPERERIAVIRDIVISVLGAVSALVPLTIAFQSVMGA
jgi:prephenate dehydrogenase